MSLANTQYDAIMREYQRRQTERQHRIEERRAEVIARGARIDMIDAEIAGISVERGRRLLSGDSSAIEDLTERIEEISARRGEALRAIGYPEDYLDVPYVCPECKDSGISNGQNCRCMRRIAVDLFFTEEKLSAILEEENFAHFSSEYYDSDVYEPGGKLSAKETAIAACRRCYDFTEHFDERFENVFLFGSTGTGKTFLTHCVARELLLRGRSVMYFSSPELFDLIARTVYAQDERSDIDGALIYECDLLIIDDLGTEMINRLTVPGFFRCLNERITNRKSTMISSNLDLSKIAEIYSERVFSRICESFIILHLFGDDIRIRKKKEDLYERT